MTTAPGLARLQAWRWQTILRRPRFTRSSGAVRKHPYDAKKFLLITSPLEEGSHFYEFRMTDVVHGRDVSQTVTEDGETIQIVEVTVRKGSFGIEMKPFEVR